MQTHNRWRYQIARGLAAVVAIVLSQLSPAADPTDPYYEYRDEVGRGEFSYDDSQDIPWIENETEVLAVPRPEHLTEVQLDQLPPGMKLLVDKSRITVNPDDRVVRAWLWTRSDSGFEKGSFEGFRCDTYDYKVYAWANPGREPPVTKAKRPIWKAVIKSRFGNYRGELMDDYFCGFRGFRDASQIADSLTGEFRQDIIQNQ